MRSIYFLLVIFALGISSCSNVPQAGDVTAADAMIDGHPAWIMQGNIYEVNTRQYTPEGTLRAFGQHLQRLKDMGVQTLWFMPIQPISVKDRKGPLGSYYAIANYTAINPEFGNMDDWKALVKNAQSMGFKVIIDWVANHTGGDHYWLNTNPDFYARDSAGNAISPFDWTDVKKLDYNNPRVADSMIAAMKFWVTETGIDGFRCDVASELPKAFWTRAISELRGVKNVFMLAEANDAWLHETGFDATYTWDGFHMMKLIAKGERPAFAMDTIVNRVDSLYRPNAIRMYFTSNHDENSWNGADWQTMPGASHAPFAVLSQTIDRSVPLIYSGQEEPFLDSIRFFYKDTITFNRYARAPFYKTLLQLRSNNPALAANASFTKLRTNNDAALYAFERERDGSRVLVLLNLGKNVQSLQWSTTPTSGDWTNVFTGKKESPANGMQLEPWAYRVYQLRP